MTMTVAAALTEDEMNHIRLRGGEIDLAFAESVARRVGRKGVITSFEVVTEGGCDRLRFTREIEKPDIDKALIPPHEVLFAEMYPLHTWELAEDGYERCASCGAFIAGDVIRGRGTWRDSCGAPVVEKYPEFKKWLDWLEE